MDPVAIDAFKRLLRSLANKGISIIVSSHHLAELDHLVDTIALLHRANCSPMVQPIHFEPILALNK